MKRKQGNKTQEQNKVFSGMIPWSRQEFNWVVDRHLNRRKQTKANQKLEAKYLSFKEQMVRLGRKTPDNFNTMILLNEIFHTSTL